MAYDDRIHAPRRRHTAILGASSVLSLSAAIVFCLVPGAPANAGGGLIEYGTENVLGTGVYPSDPKAGATLLGLAPNVVTVASLIMAHGFPFSPAPGDFPGTDQIYVGSVQTAFDDGYSQFSGRINGPDVLMMNYASLVPVGQQVVSLTLGIAADDFQNAVFGNPFTASINGVPDVPLSNHLNSLNETGPVVQFFTIGIAPAMLLSSDVLTLSITEGGTGGDGYAIDYATVGVITQSVPEPSAIILMCIGTLAVIGRNWRNNKGCRCA